MIYRANFARRMSTDFDVLTTYRLRSENICCTRVVFHCGPDLGPRAFANSHIPHRFVGVIVG